VKRDKDIIDREIAALSALSGLPGFPLLLRASHDELIMTRCGEPISAANIPDDAEQQAEALLKTLKTKKLRHNDIHSVNLMVHNGRLHLIDFGWASFGEEQPAFLPKNIGVAQGVRQPDEPFDDDIMMMRALKLVRRK
jgi:hypothetical protein